MENVYCSRRERLPNLPAGSPSHPIKTQQQLASSRWGLSKPRPDLYLLLGFLKNAVRGYRLKVTLLVRSVVVDYAL